MRVNSSIACLAVVACGLFFVSGAVADDSQESLREAAKALAAEQSPRPVGTPAGGDGTIQPMNPLFIGVDDTTINAYQINIIDGTPTVAFSGFEVWAAACDNDNDLVYFTSGSTLHVWPVGGLPTTLGGITDPTGATLSVVGLAWYGGTLYGYTASVSEGIYSIDPTTQVGTQFIATVGADTDCGGLSADPDTGIFYCTNDDSSAPSGQGLYQVNLDGSLTFVTAYPAGETDVDGLAVGGGMAYLVTDDNTPPEIYVYDLVGGAYATSLPSPWTSSEIFSGGAYILSAVPVELQSFDIE